jgi:hypothetical protein
MSLRAGRAADQSHPQWTSHAAYLGEQSPIDHQRVEVLVESLAGRALDGSGATLETEKR